MTRASEQKRRADWKAGPGQRWVCGACGKHTAIEGYRDDMRDSSCFVNAVLCHAEKRWNPKTCDYSWWAADAGDVKE